MSSSSPSSSPPLNHEPDRINRWIVFISLAAIVGSVALTHVGVSIFMHVSRENEPRPPEPNTAVFPASRDWLGGAHELRLLHEREDEHLESYQWLNAEHSAARIPIERAMQLLVEQRHATGASRGSKKTKLLSLTREAPTDNPRKGGNP